MSFTLYWMLSMILLLDLAAKPINASCGNMPQQLRLRTTSNDLATNDEDADQLLPQLDLNQLSDTQLQQLMQQLNLDNDYAEDHRGSSRPWNKVQRIIRRQLVRIPKRYLKKLLRQFGLARSSSSSGSSSSGSSGSIRSGTIQLDSEADQQLKPQPQLYYLIPLE